MTRAFIDGMEYICVSGAEGIFATGPGKEGSWKAMQVFDREVSEMTFIDLDGDGNNELVTIEPFHGNTINIYKRRGSGWEPVFTDTLSFGHGLNSGIFNGTPVILAGNRSDSLTLDIFTAGNLGKGVVNKNVVENDAGPTQTQVFSHGQEDYILSVNQKKNEVALYTGSLE
jgi:hypothetical protein